MKYTILDCYTDEAAGLGVPPYLGTYPRYIFGMLKSHNPNYITIDDLRLNVIYKNTTYGQNEIITHFILLFFKEVHDAKRQSQTDKGTRGFNHEFKRLK